MSNPRKRGFLEGLNRGGDARSEANRQIALIEATDRTNLLLEAVLAELRQLNVSLGQPQARQPAPPYRQRT